MSHESEALETALPGSAPRPSMKLLKGSIMAISDTIIRLGNQAKQLEETASTFRTDNDAELKARETELRKSLAEAKSAVHQKLEAESEAAANRLEGLQHTLSDGFEAIRVDGTPREKLDAEDAVDAAVRSLHDAAYYMLAAVAARDDANHVQDDVAPVESAAVIEGEATDGPVAEQIDAVVTSDGATTEVDAIEVDAPADEITDDVATQIVVVSDDDSSVETAATATADAKPTK
jgi:ribosomal protein RSM22 (predicted rRNA methylase)